MVDIYDPAEDVDRAESTAWGLRSSISGESIEQRLESLPVGREVEIRLAMHRNEKVNGEPVITNPEERVITVEWDGNIENFWDSYYNALNAEYDDYAEKAGVPVDTDESDGAVFVLSMIA